VKKYKKSISREGRRQRVLKILRHKQMEKTDAKVRLKWGSGMNAHQHDRRTGEKGEGLDGSGGRSGLSAARLTRILKGLRGEWRSGVEPAIPPRQGLQAGGRYHARPELRGKKLRSIGLKGARGKQPQ